jgi:hypothetical protein
MLSTRALPGGAAGRQMREVNGDGAARGRFLGGSVYSGTLAPEGPVWEIFAKQSHLRNKAIEVHETAGLLTKKRGGCCLV